MFELPHVVRNNIVKYKIALLIIITVEVVKIVMLKLNGDPVTLESEICGSIIENKKEEIV